MQTASLARPASLAVLFAGTCAVLAAACNRGHMDLGACGLTLWSEAFFALEPQGDPPTHLALVGLCLPRVPDVYEDGTPECLVIEDVEADVCDCSAPGRKPVEWMHQPLLDAAEDRGDLPQGCRCEIVALTGAEGEACRNDTSEQPSLNGEPVHGHCHLSRAVDIGNPDVIDACPGDPPR